MSKVEKDGIVMVARDKNQLAAFLNNGWKKVADKNADERPVENPYNVAPDDKSAEKTEESSDGIGEAVPSEEGQSVNTEPSKRGRKPAQK